MKNMIKMILATISLVILGSSYAANRDPIITINVNNQSSQIVHLGKTRYNETALNLTQTEVLPQAGIVEVGNAVIMDGKSNISFYIHVTNDPFTWLNTPVVRYDTGSWSSKVDAEGVGPYYPRNYVVYVDEDTVSHYPDKILNVKIVDSTATKRK
jgi:hypothetical protein